VAAARIEPATKEKVNSFVVQVLGAKKKTGFLFGWNVRLANHLASVYSVRVESLSVVPIYLY
jgi:hypothetical protein